MNALKKTFTILFILISGVFYPQEKNKSKIDNYLVDNFSLKSSQYSVKSSVETNPNYDVYYVQQKFNNIEVHNAISTMAIKNGEVKSYKNRFVDNSFGQNSLLAPKIDSYSAIEKGLNELKIREFKNSPNGWTHTNPYNVEAKLVYVVVDDKLSLTWNFNIVTTDHKNWYDVFVSAEDGKVLKKENWIIRRVATFKLKFQNLRLILVIWI